ncbi:MAG: hypothetical protein AAFW97_07440 [Pseudomonadota bacterium]
MEPWPFIIAAYACTIIGTAGLTLWSYVQMRSSEARMDALREDKSQ